MFSTVLSNSQSRQSSGKEVFANGHKKLGGRRVGTPNKATASLRERIEALDPLGDLIALARAQDTSPELKAKVLLELLSYIGAKPARGVSMEVGKPLDLESASLHESRHG